MFFNVFSSTKTSTVNGCNSAVWSKQDDEFEYDDFNDDDDNDNNDDDDDDDVDEVTTVVVIWYNY